MATKKKKQTDAGVWECICLVIGTICFCIGAAWLVYHMLVGLYKLNQYDNRLDQLEENQEKIVDVLYETRRR